MVSNLIFGLNNKAKAGHIDNFGNNNLNTVYFKNNNFVDSFVSTFKKPNLRFKASYIPADKAEGVIDRAEMCNQCAKPQNCFKELGKQDHKYTGYIYLELLDAKRNNKLSKCSFNCMTNISSILKILSFEDIDELVDNLIQGTKIKVDKTMDQATKKKIQEVRKKLWLEIAMKLRDGSFDESNFYEHGLDKSFERINDENIDKFKFYVKRQRWLDAENAIGDFGFAKRVSKILESPENARKFVKLVNAKKYYDAEILIKDPNFAKNATQYLNDTNTGHFTDLIKNKKFIEAEDLINEKGFYRRAKTSGFIPRIEGVVNRGFIVAREFLDITNKLPGFTSELCDEACMTGCINNRIVGKKPPGFREIEKVLAILDPTIVLSPPNGKSIGVIGYGIAGMTVAATLGREGYEVHAYDKNEKPGGVLRGFIPEFRLKSEIIEREAANLEKIGVKFHPKSPINTEKFKTLLADHDRIFVTVGASKPNPLNPEGKIKIDKTIEKDIYYANDFLKEAKSRIAPDMTGEKVVVLGAGNVAMDAARTAMRLVNGNIETKSEDLVKKAKKKSKENPEEDSSVNIVYRRSEGSMSAREDEKEVTKTEGIGFKTLLNPVKIYQDFDKNDKPIIKIECEKMQEGPEPKKELTVDKDAPHETIEANRIIVAYGTSIDEEAIKAMLGVNKEDSFEINKKDGRATIEIKGSRSARNKIVELKSDKNNKTYKCKYEDYINKLVKKTLFAGDTHHTKTAIHAQRDAMDVAMETDNELLAEIVSS